jgi:hypothetical protein
MAKPAKADSCATDAATIGLLTELTGSDFGKFELTIPNILLVPRQTAANFGPCDHQYD